jgi:hypothetical protein
MADLTQAQRRLLHVIGEAEAALDAYERVFHECAFDGRKALEKVRIPLDWPDAPHEQIAELLAVGVEATWADVDAYQREVN